MKAFSKARRRYSDGVGSPSGFSAGDDSTQ